MDIFVLTKSFSREYKYTLGERLKNETLDMITNIFRANSRQDKVPVLQTARENLEVIRLHVRILKDMRLVGTERFVGINERIENISKQLTGWQRHAAH